MNRRILAVLNLVMLAFVMSLALAPVDRAMAADETEDILYMADGRELHGRIISESSSQVVFELIDRVSGWRATLTFDPANVVKIDRSVPVAAVENPQAAKPAARPEAPAQSGGAPPEESTADTELPKLYILPMAGQMGTDVHADVYRSLIAHIREVDPDVLVLTMDCKDAEDRIYSRITEEDQGRHGSDALDSYRELVSLFRDELRDIPQVMWVHDSLGISSVIALAWPQIYMKPTGRLGGLRVAAANFMAVQSDANMFGKFREAYMAWLKGFVEYGGYDLALVDAMVRSEFELSASFRGREVEWVLSTDGDYVVDTNEKATVDFDAQGATNLMVSQGIAEDLDDLAFLLGYREFEVVDEHPKKEVERYTENWRRAYDNCVESLRDYRQHMEWASGDEALKWYGQAKQDLEKILAAIQRYNAVEVRMREDFGMDSVALEIRIDEIREAIRALRSGGRGGGGGGGGTGRGGAGPGRG